ncbi:dihydrofolate reductase family protein [Algoriphagus sp. NG3]|uniref:dihydrofolate reductase family protein n=1 Tax=Algoriphagus sp. NG3 TaxID=3097546 RepID=UPI002A81CA11|nr:dihydrofolate reductase family protein [Algoriphagus sp. NG3]WPR75990.1 dihydrofolate reductase family protein [Algoriphagus sp. NG3]
MRKLIAYEFLSNDGYMAGREGEEMDFVTRNFLKEMETDIELEYKEVDTFLFGRTTYESLSRYWPTVTTEDEPLADLMNGMNKIVFSSTLDDLKWNNSRLSTKGLEEQVIELKREEGKNIMIIGSASIVQSLTEKKLIDEYKFLLFPVILGDGKPLFKNTKEELGLKLIHSKIYRNGVLLLTYSI